MRNAKDEDSECAKLNSQLLIKFQNYYYLISEIEKNSQVLSSFRRIFEPAFSPPKAATVNEQIIGQLSWNLRPASVHYTHNNNEPKIIKFKFFIPSTVFSRVITWSVYSRTAIDNCNNDIFYKPSVWKQTRNKSLSWQDSREAEFFATDDEVWRKKSLLSVLWYLPCCFV